MRSKAKHAEYMRKWRLENPEKVRAAELKCRPPGCEKKRVYDALYYQANRERLLAKAQARYVPRVTCPKRGQTRSERLEHARQWHEANREQRLAQKREWARKNRDKGAAYAAARRAALRQATPAWATDFFIREAYHLASVRSKVTGIAWEVDHMVPLVSDLVCGLHVEHNLQVVPRCVNRAKHNRAWPHMP